MPRRPRTLLTAAAALLALTLPTAAHANTAAQALTQPYTLQLRPGNIWDKPFPIGAALDPTSATYGPAFARSVGITQDTNGAWKVTGPSGLRWRSAYNIYTVDTATTWKKACARNPSVAPWIPPVHERTVTHGDRVRFLAESDLIEGTVHGYDRQHLIVDVRGAEPGRWLVAIDACTLVEPVEETAA